MNTCEDVFIVCVVVSVRCDLDIDNRDKEHKFVAQKGVSYDLTVRFTYVLGTGYEEANADFGFSAVYPTNADPGMLLQNGVTITEEDFEPDEPEIENLPNALLSATYTASINFTNDETDFNTLLGRGDNNLSGTLIYHTGGMQ